MSVIADIIQEFRGSDRVRVRAATGQPRVGAGLVLPEEVVEFYRLCGGVDFLDGEKKKYVRYRILPAEKVVDIGTATCMEAATEMPLKAWYVVGEDDNGEHAAVDVEAGRRGRCYEVFHETYCEPESARIVADSFGEFLRKVFAKGKAYWFEEGVEGRYFGGK